MSVWVITDDGLLIWARFTPRAATAFLQKQFDWFSSAEAGEARLREDLAYCQQLMQEDPERFWVESVNARHLRYRTGFSMIRDNMLPYDVKLEEILLDQPSKRGA